MLRWLTPYYIRILCDCPFNGGFGYTPAEVGEMTIDQIMMLLVDRNQLRKTATGYVRQVAALESLPLADANGMIAGVSKDGKPMKGKIAGKSLARQLMERRDKEKLAREAAAPKKLSKREIKAQQQREAQQKKRDKS